MERSGDPSATLLARWQEGEDPEALNELLQIEIGILRDRVLRRYGHQLRPSVGATDIAQEAAANLLRMEDRPHFPEPAVLRAYLLTAAWRLLYRRMRRPGRQVVRLDRETQVALGDVRETASQVRALQDQDRRSLLELSMNLLRPDDQQILQLAYFERLSSAAIAERLGLGEAAARKRLERARKELATRLAGWSRLLD